GAYVRALLADRPPRQDAAQARADVSARGSFAPPSALRERPAAPRPARLVDRARARRSRVPGRARGAAWAATCGRLRRRDRALLRARHLGDGRGARPVSAVRRACGLDQDGRNPVNRALDAAAAGLGLAAASPILAAAAVA